ncbi:hypothetical protein HFO56_24140 [Rhizobium laguerreae]|uniref:hypothetical protein n=1 Tax=Rhizobium laguerreae TaxID=1076926 RepID=UPI001C921562|nr:hypothetical protein [Rhizobium laguerreae]MBY3155420.1 hypothetical protein [Rhizobium laguerreae]
MELDTSVTDILTGLEVEKSELLEKIAMCSSHLAYIRRPEEQQDADREKSLLAMYEQAGVVLPQTVLRRFEEVRSFLDSVSSNRKAWLADQAKDYDDRIAGYQQRLLQVNALKHEVMATLSRAGVDRPRDVGVAEARLVERPSG